MHFLSLFILYIKHSTLFLTCFSQRKSEKWQMVSCLFTCMCASSWGFCCLGGGHMFLYLRVFPVCHSVDFCTIWLSKHVYFAVVEQQFVCMKNESMVFFILQMHFKLKKHTVTLYPILNMENNNFVGECLHPWILDIGFPEQNLGSVSGWRYV